MGRKGWGEGSEIKVDGGWAHGSMGVQGARRLSGLAQTARKNQSSCTGKAILRG